jgi:SAM-dependent methyltransferase
MVDTFLKTYFKNRPFFLGLIRAKELELFHRFLPPAAALSALRILDFGSGDGFFTRTLFNGERVPLCGIDTDNRIVGKALTEGIYNQLPLYDGVRVPFKENSFDLIISNSVLEHVEDLPQTVQELSRILTRGGTLLCSVMTGRWEEYLAGRFFLGQSYAGWLRRRQRHNYLLSCDEWHNHFEKGGFRTGAVIGYMDKKASRWLELFHYLSFHALIVHRLCGRWVLLPRLFDLVSVHTLLAQLVREDVPVPDAAALFFKLVKDS